ncbi:MAG: chemotaxis protein MotB [Candidatus Dadabacteria bacterium]|nr:MAG: chemotaxis protein MotB [Candidatus Dadabacteria bacterium]
MAEEKPIIVIKKKGGHGGHHGGAWKVAYADFVTAMMSFFLVMWLINSADVATKQNIASYFKKPGLFSSGSGTPLMIGEAGILKDAYVPYKGDKTKNAPGEGEEDNQHKHEGKEKVQGMQGGKDIQKETKLNKLKTGGPAEGQKTQLEVQKEAFEQVAEQIRREIAASPELKELLGIVDVKVEADGLNIEIIDTEKTSMFALGSARILPEARRAFLKLGRLIKKLPNKIDIIGHTDARPFSRSGRGYTNWELSADRANAARKLLLEAGIKPEQISSVVGRADRDLRIPEKPFDAANRRITLKMRFNLSKKIDISDNPSEIFDQVKKYDAIDRQKRSEEHHQPEEAEQQPTTLIYTPKKIIKAAKKEKKRIPLPSEEEIRRHRRMLEKDKIFGDTPVVEPPDPFAGL